jgi:hypothetical protein
LSVESRGKFNCLLDIELWLSHNALHYSSTPTLQYSCNYREYKQVSLN